MSNRYSHQKKKGKKVKEEELRPVDRYFLELDQLFPSPGNRLGYCVSLFLLYFGVMGCIWMIPFPQIGLLVRMEMNDFLNWGSFFIAITIYIYLKLAPTLSYMILFCLAIMSFFIVRLEYIQWDGGPAVVLVCSLIAVASFILLRLLAAREPKKITIKDLWKLISIGPIWLWSKLFTKLGWKY